MHDVHEATDAGTSTFLFNEGLRTHDKYPQVQYTQYSEWFTYIYARVMPKQLLGKYNCKIRKRIDQHIIGNTRDFHSGCGTTC